MIHPYGEWEQTFHRERIVFSPPRKNRREEQERERHRSPVSQHMTVSHSRIPVTLSTSVCDAMSKNLQQISQSPFFFLDIEKTNLPRRFTRPTFTIYYGKTNPVECVIHYNQSMAIYSKNEALMCKIFPSSLGAHNYEVVWWVGKKDLFEGIMSWLESSGQDLWRAVGPRSHSKGETLRAYVDHYWELYNENGGDNGGIIASTFKVGLPIDSNLRASLEQVNGASGRIQEVGRWLVIGEG